ncbi:hypothetical protein ENBRE01_0406 [Enteropsectra breve]|nr:hypothetical protein ENBRE01_0406 [Enteropsectra breve]
MKEKKSSTCRKELQEEIKREIERMRTKSNTETKRSIEMHKKAMESALQSGMEYLDKKIKKRLKTLNGISQAFKNLEHEYKRINTDKIMREIESYRTKMCKKIEAKISEIDGIKHEQKRLVAHSLDKIEKKSAHILKSAK